jgi:hypothetical protein
MNTYEQLVSEIEDQTVLAYQNASLLGLFQGVDIGDIGVEQWFHKNLDDIPDAALSLAGFDPSDAKLNADLFGHKVLTAAERLRISEKELKQFQKFGIVDDGIAMLGEKVAEVASNYLFRGVDMNGDSPSGESNYIEATGTGTLASPSIITSALTGAWGTYANKVTDCYRIVGDLQSAGFNPATSVAFYPKAAYGNMHKIGAVGEMSAIQMLKEQGLLDVIALDDQYMWTDAAAPPTNALFDLYVVDLASVKIGYTRTEGTIVIAPHDEVRDTVVETEVWFVPYFIPKPKSSSIRKGVSRITAIAQA